MAVRRTGRSAPESLNQVLKSTAIALMATFLAACSEAEEEATSGSDLAASVVGVDDPNAVGGVTDPNAIGGGLGPTQVGPITVSFVGSCPLIAGERVLGPLDFPVAIDRLAAVVDGAGVYTIIEHASLTGGAAPVVFTPCDGSAPVDLASVDVLPAPFDPKNLIVQDEDNLYIAEAGTTIVQIAKAGGARTDLVTGETEIRALAVIIEGGVTTLAYVANDNLKIFSPGGSPRTIAVGIRENSLDEYCHIPGLNASEVFVICGDKTLRAYNRITGVSRLMFEADIIEFIKGRLFDEAIFFIHEEECEVDSEDCFLTEPILKVISTAGGIPLERENLGLEGGVFDVVGATADRVLVEGRTKGAFSLSQRNIIGTPLVGGARFKANAEGDFLAADEFHAYYYAEGELVATARNTALIDTSTAVAAEPAVPSCAATDEVDYIAQGSYTFSVNLMDGVADGGGVFALPSQSGVVDGVAPVQKFFCGSASSLSISNFDIPEQSDARVTEIEQDGTNLFIMEEGADLFRLSKGGGAPVPMITGETNARSLVTVEEGGPTQLFWMSTFGVRTMVDGAAGATTIPTTIPPADLDGACYIAGVDATYLYIVCNDQRLDRVTRADGTTLTLLERLDDEQIAAKLRGAELYLTQNLCPTGITDCEPEEMRQELWLLSTAGGATPELLRTLDIHFDALPTPVHFTADHVILSGLPKGFYTSEQPTLASVPLDRAGRTETIAAQGYFVAGDDANVFYTAWRGTEPDFLRVSP